MEAPIDLPDEATLARIADVIKHLKHDVLEPRLEAATHLREVAQVLKPERTRSELVPFICSELLVDDDKMLLEIAKQISDFVPLVGGPAYAQVLISTFEGLVTTEDLEIRRIATDGLYRVVESMSPHAVERYVQPFICRIASYDWYCNRLVAASLLIVTIQKLMEINSESLEDMFSLFHRLCIDDTPMVRRQAMSVFSEFFRRDPKIELFDWFEKLTKDEQDGIRLLTIKNCIRFATVECEQDSLLFDRILDCVYDCSKDTSWRVRYMVANDLADFCEAYKEHLWKVDSEYHRMPSAEDHGPEEEPDLVHRPIDDVMTMYGDLLDDSEVEVRTRAVSKLEDMAKVYPKDAFFDKTEYQLMKMVTESRHDMRIDTTEKLADQARVALAGTLLAIAPIFSQATTIRRIIPIFLQLMRDEAPEVRLKLIGTLPSLTGVISDFDFLTTSLLPALEELAGDKNWRTRLTVLELAPTLAVALGEKMFMERYHDVCCANWFEDKAHAVRVRAAETMSELCDIFGVDRCIALVLPWLLKNARHTSYLIRVNVLLTIAVLSKKLAEDMVISQLLPIVTDLSKDPVANVRVSIARALDKIGKIHQTPAFHAEAKKILDSLAEKDEDADVLFFVKQSKDALIKAQVAAL